MITIRVGVILVYKNKNSDYQYLCVYQNASNLWGFPKGRLNTNKETFKEGACRELFEETGITIYPHQLYNEDTILIKRGKHKHYYFLKYISTKPTVFVDNYEISDYKWMTIDELSFQKTSYFTGQIIKNYMSNDDEMLLIK